MITSDLDFLTMESRSIPLAGSKAAGSTEIFVSSLFPEEELKLPENYCHSPFEAFYQNYIKNPDLKLIVPISSSGSLLTSYITNTTLLYSLLKFGLGYKNYIQSQKPILGICLGCCPEWLIVDLACQAFEITTVILNEKFNLQNMIHVLNETKLHSLVGDHQLFLQLIKVKDKLPHLKNFITVDLKQDDVKYPIHYIHIEEIYQIGWRQGGLGLKYKIPKKIDPHKVSTICYTSGTTSLPKGVLLTPYHLSSAIFNLELSFYNLEFDKMTSFEYLSYSHLPIRIQAYLSLKKGQQLSYSNSINKDSNLLKEIIKCKPHQFHLSSIITDNIINELENIAEQKGLKKELNSFIESLAFDNANESHLLLKQQVFQPLQQSVGDQLKLITSFNFAISSYKLELLRTIFQVQIIQSYGLTESCGQGFRTSPMERGFGVGGVVPLTQAKLVDCLELEYSVNDLPYPRGEIYLKGPHLFQGYFGHKNNPLDKNGWYPTGDIASLDPKNGTFSIIDRKANFFKLSKGIYITPEKVESAYKKLSLIEEIYVPTLTLHQAKYVIGIIYPNLDQFAGWASYQLERNILKEEIIQLIKNKEMVQSFLIEINRSVKSFKLLNSDELLFNIHIVLEPFTANMEFVTSNYNLKRSHLKSHFSQVIDTLANHSLIPKDEAKLKTNPVANGGWLRLKSLL